VHTKGFSIAAPPFFSTFLFLSSLFILHDCGIIQTYSGSRVSQERVPLKLCRLVAWVDLEDCPHLLAIDLFSYILLLYFPSDHRRGICFSPQDCCCFLNLLRGSCILQSTASTFIVAVCHLSFFNISKLRAAISLTNITNLVPVKSFASYFVSTRVQMGYNKRMAVVP
jgi:hypothetical protein